MAIQRKEPGDLAARMSQKLSQTRQRRPADGWKREFFHTPS